MKIENLLKIQKNCSKHSFVSSSSFVLSFYYAASKKMHDKLDKTSDVTPSSSRNQNKQDEIFSKLCFN